MGTQDISGDLCADGRRRFTQHLLADLRAMEHMIEAGVFETGVRRIGAEQELFLIDQSWRAAPISRRVLNDIDDPRFTTELAKFNLEFNCDPLLYGGKCLSQLEAQICEMLEKARIIAARHGTEILIAGILPTLHKSDLDLSNMTDMPRYAALNAALTRERGDAYSFRIRGTDELNFKHYSVMLEACNTSFQVHFQVDPSEFATLYNIAQAVTGPVLAVSTNSPLLFGKRLWSETRIALFQQSVDTRKSGHHFREVQPRVRFGTNWVKNSVLEIYREDVSRFKSILGTDIDEDPLEMIKQGLPPKLKALNLHNSTVYRWNRPCYGITDGRPHLRIENRVLPAGPTPTDEVANAAFWFGLMNGLAAEHKDIRHVMDFDDAKHNFLQASRHGLDAKMTWTHGKKFSAPELIQKELLPMAREGLKTTNIDTQDIDLYLGIIEERVRTQRTGSSWLLGSLSDMKDKATPGEQLHALTAATLARQKTGEPVHRWEPARVEESGGWKHNFRTVEQFMVTDLYTVNEEESIDLVANLMDWAHIRHVPVEDNEQRLAGLVSYRQLIRYLARNTGADEQAAAVSKIMSKELITIEPETSSLEAIKIMRENRVGCLPVVQDERLVGIITEADFTEVARQLLEEHLRLDE